jgi:hypothetical protein
MRENEDMRAYGLAFMATALVALALGCGPAAAKHHHGARAQHRLEPKAVEQVPAPATPSAASTYLNHIVEGDMTQDQLDRTPGR